MSLSAVLHGCHDYSPINFKNMEELLKEIIERLERIEKNTKRFDYPRDEDGWWCEEEEEEDDVFDSLM